MWQKLAGAPTLGRRFVGLPLSPHSHLQLWGLTGWELVGAKGSECSTHLEFWPEPVRIVEIEARWRASHHRQTPRQEEPL